MPDPFDFFSILGRALTFDKDVYRLIEQAPWRTTLVTLIVVLSGLSEALGQSIVLFASRVKKRRFAFSLIFSALVYIFSFSFLSLCVWLVASYIFGIDVGFDVIVRTVGLGYAPYLFSFFILAPYFGNPISVLLSVWSLIAINLGLITVLELGFVQALLCTTLGWLLVQLIQRTVGRPLVGGVRWLRRRVAGAPVITSRAEWRELFDLPQRPRAMLKFPKRPRGRRLP